MSSELQRNPQELLNDCKSHLVAERELLERFVDETNKLHDLLGESVFPEVKRPTDYEQELASEAAVLSQSRVLLRRKIAKYLNISEADASIRKLASTLSDHDAKPLLEERERILDLRNNIVKLTKSNAVMLNQSLDIYYRLFQVLAGQSPESQTYSATGQVNAQQNVSLVSAKG